MPATNFPDGVVIGDDPADTSAVDGQRSAAIADLNPGTATASDCATAINDILAALRKVGVVAE